MKTFLLYFLLLNCFNLLAQSYDPLKAQPGFESSIEFTNWQKAGAGNFVRNANNQRSGSFKAELNGNLQAGGRVYNPNYSIITPATGTNYVTIVAWARRSTGGTPLLNLHAATSEATLPLSGGLTTSATVGSGWTRVTYTFLAQNNTTYFPVIYASSALTNSCILWLDDVVFYTSEENVLDVTVPNNVPFGFKLNVVSDDVSFTFTGASDNETGIDKVVIVRYNVTNQSSNPPILQANTFYSINSEIGPNTLSGGTIVFAGPALESFSERVISNDIMTYIVYVQDKALNGNAGTGSKVARIIILKAGKKAQSGSSNFTCAAIWIGSGSTYEILSSATMNFADNGTAGSSSIFGTMHQNKGNINPRGNSSANLVYKNGGTHINSRDRPEKPDGNYLPRATWEEGSTAIVDGRKPSGMGGTGQVFHHFIWNTNSLESDFQFDKGFGVKGDFTIYNTEDNVSGTVRTLYMSDTTMELGGNFIIDDISKAKVIFPGPTGDLKPYGPGNNLKLVGTGNQMLVNNNLEYDLFSVDVSKPSGSFVLQQDLKLRGGLNYDSGTIAMNDFKLIMQGSKGNAAMPQYISGYAPLNIKEVIINNTNNEPVISKMIQDAANNLTITLPDSNYVKTSSNLTISEKLTMTSGKLIIESKTLTLPKTIEYTHNPALLANGGTNNFFGGRNTGNLKLTGNLNHLLFWGDSYNELDTFRVSYSSAKTATVTALSDIFTQKLLIEDSATLVNTVNVAETFIWALDSLFVKSTASLTNEISKVPVEYNLTGSQNGFGFALSGNARIDGQWNWADPLASEERVLFKGNKNQIFSGQQPVTFYNMELDNEAELNIMNAATVSKKLIFTKGIINTNKTNTFLLQPEAIAYNASDISFINGPMVRNLDPDVLQTSTLNPVGKKGSSKPYRPVTLYVEELTEGLGLSIEYFYGKTAHEEGIMSSSYLSGINEKEYWEINKSITYATVPIKVRIGLRYLKPENSKWAPFLPDVKDKVGITHGTIVGDKVNWSLAGEEEPGFSIKEEGDFKNAGTWDSEYFELWTPPVSSFSPFGFGFFGSKLILPVELLSFRVSEYSTTPILNWEIASVTDLLQFEVRHSLDGQNFSPIQLIKPQGEKYQYTHLQAGKGRHYYRLKWKQKDGKEKYSAVQSIILGNEKSELFSVGPIPFHHQVNLAIWSKQGQMASYTLHDQTGKMIRNGKLTLQKGSNNVFIADLTNLQKGNYYLQITFDDGLKTVRPLMK